MVRYHELGYSTFKEYFEEFIKTLLPTNKTYEYFVDWNKVRKLALRHRENIKELNRLYGMDQEEAKFELRKILQENPSVLPVIPTLIAERSNKGKINVYDPDKMKFLEFDFTPHFLTDNETNSIVEFCEKSGVLEILTKIQNLDEYLLGVEVGLDTNARKGRSGDIFERMVLKLIKKHLPQYVSLVPQDRTFSLYETIGRTRKEKAKRHDFVVYHRGQPVATIEVNFYNSTGSKPIEIVGSYITLNRAAKEKGIIFVWITDGPAWKKMKEPLLRGMKEIDWVVNYSQLPKLLAYFNSINWEMGRS
ncbi:DpnII family type II restriction endonuclease [Thermococcus sp. GR4]|uniref:DpnII family type II restriction endonuclease n=1 Tax=Thermococcus sp. GR4 TaxID=1638254 RepID=UPI001430BC91|nr:DpnII family type II restriction endonuclease [Thermococcus sp. GR4]NJE79541.1 type II restriction endonuclease [Thermococcus sp. GR4]